MIAVISHRSDSDAEENHHEEDAAEVAPAKARSTPRRKAPKVAGKPVPSARHDRDFIAVHDNRPQSHRRRRLQERARPEAPAMTPHLLTSAYWVCTARCLTACAQMSVRLHATIECLTAHACSPKWDLRDCRGSSAPQRCNPSARQGATITLAGQSVLWTVAPRIAFATVMFAVWHQTPCFAAVHPAVALHPADAELGA